MYETLRKKFSEIVAQANLESEEVKISGRALTEKEAIGNPEHRDYPLQKGKERLMQAEFRGSFGQAFTDMSGNFEGRLSQIVEMNLADNFRRAIFISTINAVMRYLGLIDKSIHCKDTSPVRCSKELVKFLKEEYGKPKVALVGLQPRMLEALSGAFDVKVMDLDENNIGQKAYGIMIGPPQRTEANLNWCDIALITGTTLTNDTISEFKTEKPVIFYGVTIAGPARLLGLEHFCPYSL
jgi:uncharacterized protein (DUF4213/DUF364 family)